MSKIIEKSVSLLKHDIVKKLICDKINKCLWNDESFNKIWKHDEQCEIIGKKCKLINILRF